MPMSIKDLIKSSRNIPISEKDLDKIRERLKNNSIHEENKITNEFLNRTYRI